MKKLLNWLRDTYQEDRRKHPTRNSIMNIAVESIMAMLAGFALILGDAEKPPVAAALGCIILMFWGGCICHEVDCIIGRKRNDWWHLDITDPQIISLIHALAKAQEDIKSGKIAWKAAFYDPSTHAVEVTRVPLEEYLADATTEQNAAAADPNPTVPKESRQ
jgi:hypothetical protein